MPGDLSNLIIGQGDLLVTPLQVCCGYAGAWPPGACPEPVLLHSVMASDGETVGDRRGALPGRRTVQPDFDRKNIDIMRSGFRGVVAEGCR